MTPRSIGFPRMHKEAGEHRDFLPDLVRFVGGVTDAAIVLEEGYGTDLGLDPERYQEAALRVRFATYDEVLVQDIVVVLRCPDESALDRISPGGMLVSMLHAETWPARIHRLESLGVLGLSLDAVVDDTGARLVENLQAVGWNGTREAFKEIEKRHPHFAHPSRRPLHVTCLGAGAVGGHAIRAATRYGDSGLRDELASRDVPGVEVTVADFDLTRHEDYMLSQLEATDLLIDATQRSDQCRPVVPNAWLAALPGDSVLLDLSADPYDLTIDPPRLKGIEGVPHGDLDQWLFPEDDPAWDALGSKVATTHRRTALSCYAWPGLRPWECMSVYGRQLEPLLALILSRPADVWDGRAGTVLERAASRALVIPATTDPGERR